MSNQNIEKLIEEITNNEELVKKLNNCENDEECEACLKEEGISINKEDFEEHAKYTIDDKNLDQVVGGRHSQTSTLAEIIKYFLNHLGHKK